MTELLLNWLPILGTVFLTICYLPQIVKTVKTKNVEGMSVLFWASLNIALTCLLINTLIIYLEYGTWGPLVTEILNEGLALVMLILVLKHKKKNVSK